MRFCNAIIALVAPLVLLSSLAPAAQADETSRAHMSEIIQKCKGGGTLSRKTAPSIISACTSAFSKLQNQYDDMVLDSTDRAWYNLHSGAALLIISGAQVVNNNDRLSRSACTNVMQAHALWAAIDAKPGSEIKNDITNDALMDALYPPCKKAMARSGANK